MATYVIGGVIGSPSGENINREPIRPPNVLTFRRPHPIRNHPGTEGREIEYYRSKG